MSSEILIDEKFDPLSLVKRNDLPCKTFDGHLVKIFYSNKAVDKARAKSICADCPAIVECYTIALERAEASGIWGGVDFSMTTIHPTIVYSQREYFEPVDPATFKDPYDDWGESPFDY